jgi:hypothetical protein
MVLAIEQIRRMRGGAQSHLMRCSDDKYYVVKFQNNLQGLPILANELLGTRLAARLGLRVPEADIVDVREDLIANTEDMVMQLGRERAPCKAGRQFPASPRKRRSSTSFPMSSCRDCRILRTFWEFWFSTSGPATRMAGKQSFFATGRRRNIRLK